MQAAGETARAVAYVTYVKYVRYRLDDRCDHTGTHGKIDAGKHLSTAIPFGDTAGTQADGHDPAPPVIGIGAK